LSIRDREGGPVAWAAHQARASYSSSWRAVLLLINRGAAWIGEQEFGHPVTTMFALDVQDRRGEKRPVSQEMLALEAKFAQP